MTPIEILSIVCGLGIGYWLVSLFSSRPVNSEKEDVEPESTQSESFQHWYEVLGVSASASKEEVAAAYREKMAQYHPDKVATMGPEIRNLAEVMATQINAAYREAKRRP